MTNRIIQACIEKIVSVPLGHTEQYYSYAWSLHQESVSRTVLLNAFAELLFQRLEFAVFLDPYLRVHAEAQSDASEE